MELMPDFEEFNFADFGVARKKHKKDHQSTQQTPIVPAKKQIEDDLEFAVQYLKEKDLQEAVIPEHIRRPIIENALEKYVELTRHNRETLLRHSCLEDKCHYTAVVIKHYGNHTCAIGSREKVCVGELMECPLESTSFKKCLWTENMISECSVTGRIHWCDSNCKYKKPDKDTSTIICRLSGNTTMAPYEVGNKQTTTLSYNDYIAGKKAFGDPVFGVVKKKLDFQTWIHDLIQCQTVSAINEHVKSTMKIASSTQEKYKVIACGKIWCLFCPEKYKKEEERMKRNQMMDFSIIKNRCETHKAMRSAGKRTLLIWPELFTQFAKLQARRTFPLTYLYSSSQDPEEMKKMEVFVAKYAVTAMQLWIMLKEVNTEETQKPLNNFSDFVIPALYILKEGIEYPSLKTNITILQADKALLRCLPEEQTLNEMLGVKNNFMDICLAIRNSFTRALEQKVDLDRLKIQFVDLEHNKHAFPPISKNNSSMYLGTFKKRKRTNKRS